MPAEISDMQNHDRISDQASIADWADSADMLKPLGSLHCSDLCEAQNSNKADAQDSIRADDELLDPSIEN
jgi:hypothetical protein